MALNKYEKIALLDDWYWFSTKNKFDFHGIKIIGNLDFSQEIFYEDIYKEAIVAIGDSITRKEQLFLLNQ